MFQVLQSNAKVLALRPEQAIWICSDQRPVKYHILRGSRRRILLQNRWSVDSMINSYEDEHFTIISVLWTVTNLDGIFYCPLCFYDDFYIIYIHNI